MLNEAQVRKTFELLEIPPERITEGSPLCIQCPFEDKHTKPTKERDCQLYFEQGPNLFCFHQSCKEELQELAQFLRFEVTGSCRGEYEFRAFIGPKPDLGLGQEITESRPDLIKKYSGRIKLGAPEAISSVEFLTRLFKPEDVLWVGQEHHSGEKFAHHFRTLTEWKLKPPPPNWNFTTGATFWPGSCRRSNESVAQRRYLILESDSLNAEDFLAMVAWARAELKLRLAAVLFSGRRSIHVWATWPGEDWFREYKPALEAAGFDVNTMRKSQAVRLGGAIRCENGRKQEVLWLQK